MAVNREREAFLRKQIAAWMDFRICRWQDEPSPVVPKTDLCRRMVRSWQEWSSENSLLCGEREQFERILCEMASRRLSRMKSRVEEAERSVQPRWPPRISALFDTRKRAELQTIPYLEDRLIRPALAGLDLGFLHRIRCALSQDGQVRYERRQDTDWRRHGRRWFGRRVHVHTFRLPAASCLKTLFWKDRTLGVPQAVILAVDERRPGMRAAARLEQSRRAMLRLTPGLLFQEGLLWHFALDEQDMEKKLRLLGKFKESWNGSPEILELLRPVQEQKAVLVAAGDLAASLRCGLPEARSRLYEWGLRAADYLTTWTARWSGPADMLWARVREERAADWLMLRKRGVCRALRNVWDPCIAAVFMQRILAG